MISAHILHRTNVMREDKSQTATHLFYKYQFHHSLQHSCINFILFLKKKFYRIKDLIHKVLPHAVYCTIKLLCTFKSSS